MKTLMLFLTVVAGPALASQTYVFMGCRPSAGECYNSCPDHQFQALVSDQDHPECADTYNEPVSCYCAAGNTGPEVPNNPQPNDPQPNDPAPSDPVPGPWFDTTR